MDTKDTALIQKIKEGKKRKIVIRQNIITSQQHTLKTVTMEKTALSGYDIKRLIMNDNIHTLPHGHYRYRFPQQKDPKEGINQQNETIQDIDWDENITILQNDTDNMTKNEKNVDNEENTSLYENIDWGESPVPFIQTTDMENEENNEENDRENTINSLCMDIDWSDISIVDEKNILPSQTTGKEEQRMLDTFLEDINWDDTQMTRNIYENRAGEEEKGNNTGGEENTPADIYNWFEENNVNSYDMEAGWEIPAFSMPE